MLRRRWLIGAVCTLAAAAHAAPTPREQSLIDRLIRYVETQQDMTFVRNGSEYSCADAGKFLRGKLEAMGSDVMTAREFIERIATKSSMSGKPYHVKFADGRMVRSSEFLGAELKRMEASS